MNLNSKLGFHCFDYQQSDTIAYLTMLNEEDISALLALNPKESHILGSSKKISKPRILEQIKPYASGRWTIQEQHRYVEFMRIERVNSNSLDHNGFHRNRDLFFLDMSIYVITRSPYQCKSHHQKSLKRYFLKKEEEKLT